MSLPIRDTPVLRGKDAIRFLEQMEIERTRRIPKEELDRMNRNYEIFKTLLNKNDKRD